MTRRPGDFNSMSAESTLWSVPGEDLIAQDGTGDAERSRMKLIFVDADNGLDLTLVSNDNPDNGLGVEQWLGFDQVQELADQLNAWLAWKRGCPHPKSILTDHCGEISCWNYQRLAVGPVTL